MLSPPIGFSERIAAVIRRRVAHIVSFVVLFSLSLSLKFSLSFGFCGISFYSSLSRSLSSRRALKGNVSLALSLSLSFSLSSFPLALFRVGQRQKRFLLQRVLLRFLKEKFPPQKLCCFRVSFFLTETVDFFFPKQTHLHAFLKSVLWGNR